MKRSTRGYVLPFVVIALAAASALAFSLASEGWHHARAVLLAGQGDAVANAVEEGEALALAQWAADSLWLYPLHHSVTRVGTSQLGQSVTIEWHRPHPLVAWLKTSQAVGANARRAGIQRELVRAVWLQAPSLSITAALSVPGRISGAEGTLISGSDQPTPGSACGMVRDTASVAAVAARAVEGDPPGSWPGAPVPDSLARLATDTIEAALPLLRARAEQLVAGTAPAPLPVRTGWRALWLRGTTVIVEGPSHWRGLLVVEGDLEVRGTVTLEGLLIVRGSIDARAGQWTVQGAAVSTDTVTAHSRLGAHTRIFYDRCAVQMALATVARPRITPFSLWQPLAQ